MGQPNFLVNSLSLSIHLIILFVSVIYKLVKRTFVFIKKVSHNKKNNRNENKK